MVIVAHGRPGHTRRSAGCGRAEVAGDRVDVGARVSHGALRSGRALLPRSSAGSRDRCSLWSPYGMGGVACFLHGVVSSGRRAGGAAGGSPRSGPGSSGVSHGSCSHQSMPISRAVSTEAITSRSLMVSSSMSSRFTRMSPAITTPLSSTRSRMSPRFADPDYPTAARTSPAVDRGGTGTEPAGLVISRRLTAVASAAPVAPQPAVGQEVALHVHLGLVERQDVARGRDPAVFDDLDPDQPAVFRRLHLRDPFGLLPGQIGDVAVRPRRPTSPTGRGTVRLVLGVSSSSSSSYSSSSKGSSSISS